MPFRRRNTTRSFQRSRRESLWIGVVPARTVLASAGSAVLSHSLNAAALALRPFTIVRSRLLFWCSSDQVAADEFIGGAVGMAVVSSQAVAIGITAVPTPDTDRGSDLWMLYEDIGGNFVVGGTADSVGISSIARWVDSKAMRKVEDGNDLVIVEEAVVGSAGITVSVAGRLLVKLH